MPHSFLVGMYPEDLLPPHMISYWAANLKTVRSVADRLDTGKSIWVVEDGFFSLFRFSNLIRNGVIMSNGRSKTVRNQSGSVAAQPGTNKWLSIPLDDEDITALTATKEKLEYLSAALLSMVSDTVCVSVKHQPERNQYCVSIYRPSRDNSGVVVGLSGFSTDLRDAILVALYKYHTKLGGSFDLGLGTDAFDKPQRRFG